MQKKILGTEIGEFKKLGEGEYEQEFKCDIIDGAKVEKPVTVVMHFTLQGEFLIMEENYPDSDYAPLSSECVSKSEMGIEAVAGKSYTAYF